MQAKNKGFEQNPSRPYILLFIAMAVTYACFPASPCWRFQKSDKMRRSKGVSLHEQGNEGRLSTSTRAQAWDVLKAAKKLG